MSLIEVEVKENVAVLTINRPKALNALNSEVLFELDKALDSIDTEIIRSVVITGSGDKAFVAGADISEMSSLSKKEGEAYGRLGNKVFLKLERFPVPVIAAVNGYALGGGCELSLCCDIRLASDLAVFGQPEVGLGITPGFGGTQRMARLIGMGKAKELLFTARNINAPEALSIGLVQAVYPVDQLMDEAMKIAYRIASNAPIAVRNVKKSINEGIELGINEAIVLEAKYFGDCFESKDQREGMSAFLEKRKHEPFVNH